VAKFTVFAPNAAANFDTFDINSFWRNKIDTDLSDNIFAVFEGNTYEDQAYIKSKSGLIEGRLVGLGAGLTGTGNTLTGGTITAMLFQYGPLNITLQAFEGVNTSAVAFQAAMETPGTADDLALLRASYAGNDTMTLSEVADRVNGFNGNDVIIGKGGDDYIDGGAGADTLRGGLGNDTFLVDNLGDRTEELADGGKDTVRAAINWTLADHVENLILSAGSGSINGTGNDAANVITGNGSTNVLMGRDGDDILTGSGGSDSLRGGLGNDVLKGGSGRDRLFGDAGRDTMTGGTGADAFVFTAGSTSAARSASDLITDFSKVEGDRIDLAAIDASTLTSGNQAFTFIGTSAFTAAGQLRFVKTADRTFIEGDTNGDGAADLAIRLSGLHTLVTGDFVL
jgi:Ca2+-binding RTX toxin-like protein